MHSEIPATWPILWCDTQQEYNAIAARAWASWTRRELVGVPSTTFFCIVEGVAPIIAYQAKDVKA